MAMLMGNGKCSVDFETMNEYNLVILNLMSYFAEVPWDDKDADVLRMVVEEVDEGIRLHLREEERFLESLDYPYIDAHKDRYLLFLDQMKILKELCWSGQPHLVRNILLSLQCLLVHHMFNFENEYCMFSESGRLRAVHQQQKVANS